MLHQCTGNTSLHIDCLLWCWSVDAGVGREMGRSGASSSPCGPTADQRICFGPRGMSLEVVGSRCSAKTLKNKIEFYNIIKLDYNIIKLDLKLDFQEDLMTHVS